MNRLPMLVLLGLSLTLSACEKKEEYFQPTTGSASAQQEATADPKRNAFVSKVQKEMDELNTKLGELKNKAQSLSGEAKVKIDQQILKLEQEQKAAVKKLDELKSATGEKWNDLKAGASDAVERFKQSIQKAKDGS